MAAVPPPTAAPVAAAGTSGDAAAAGPLLEATSQVTRFHIVESTADRSIVLQQVNLSVAGRPLLTDAVLELRAGERYALVGRNGVGKSSLLRVLGGRAIVGMPRWLTCHHVAQEATAATPVAAVLAADARGAALQRDAALLEAALDAGDDEALVRAVAALRVGEAGDAATEANADAARRSGRRGVAARKAALAAEAGVAAVAAAAATLTPEQAAAEAQGMLARLYEEQAAADADAADGRARQILAGLGFSGDMMDAPIARLSGGWRMRVALAAGLFAAADVLCLDEPTNHLDLPAILWLREYLTRCLGGSDATPPTTLLVVSHDRSFLDAVCGTTIELRDKTLRYFDGRYSEMMAARAERAACALRQAAALDKQRQHIEASIKSAERQARAAGDDKKLGQVASRRKKLEERHGLERSAKGTRFKLNRDMIGYFESRRPGVQLEVPEKPFKFGLPEPEPLRGGGRDMPLVQLRGVSFTYPGAAAPVLHGVTMDVLPGSRIALVGANGAGKSTLLQLLVGALQPNAPPAGWSPPPPKPPPGSGGKGPPVSARAAQRAARGLAVSAAQLPSAQAAAAAAAAGGAAAAGSVERAFGARCALFGQHCISELDVDTPLLVRLQEQYPGALSREQEWINFLGAFGLGPHAHQPLRTLSGGQQARAALALLLGPPSASRVPHVLLLDEPTNHLDLQAAEALAAAVRAYAGAVVVASHDMAFVADVVGDDSSAGGGGGGGHAGGGDDGAVEASAAAAPPGTLFVVADRDAARWERGVAAYVEQQLARVRRRHPLAPPR